VTDGSTAQAVRGGGDDDAGEPDVSTASFGCQWCEGGLGRAAGGGVGGRGVGSAGAGGAGGGAAEAGTVSGSSRYPRMSMRHSLVAPRATDMRFPLPLLLLLRDTGTGGEARNVACQAVTV